MGTRTQVRVGVKTQLCQAPRDTAPEVWGMSASGQSQVYWGGGVSTRRDVVSGVRGLTVSVQIRLGGPPRSTRRGVKGGL